MAEEVVEAVADEVEEEVVVVADDELAEVLVVVDDEAVSVLVSLFVLVVLLLEQEHASKNANNK